ncbi:Trehalose transport system permease protein SugB [Microbacterium lemovicicum]|uniref:Trehalose transport system permease protein SugB n=1 Tax=Microbacterium lemovicicum TaxID=1072463 RepID=A0A3Q9J1Z0_9MICO|nr:carbohydrate ABC transporter permease [Microbacterium lemovicicum]AZS38610.1 Trehalose transport system permease protein SugB [Microbacterium lemovicicum]
MSLIVRDTEASTDSATRTLTVPRRRRAAKVRASSTSRPGRPSGTITAVKWLVISAAIVLSLLPILYMIGMSFKSPDDILSTRILPSRLAFENWASAFQNFPILTYLRNSVGSALIAVLVALLVAVPANYAIARLRAGGKQALGTLVSAYIAPPVVAIVPLFVLVRTVGLMDSVIGLGIVEGLLLTPVAVWLLDGFFRAIPFEIDEAAQIDGCGPFRTLWSVILPLTAPGIVAVSIIVFILVYNDFLIPLLLTQSVDSQTLPVGISLMQGGREVVFGQMAAASLAGLIPIYLLAMFLQKWLVGGLTQGSVK